MIYWSADLLPLEGYATFFILDNVQTMANTPEMLALLRLKKATGESRCMQYPLPSCLLQIIWTRCAGANLGLIVISTACPGYIFEAGQDLVAVHFPAYTIQELTQVSTPITACM